MALWTITSKKTRPQEEVESQETRERKGWLRITLAVVLLALAAYGILQVLGVFSPTPANAPAEAGAAPPVVQVTAPPVVEPEPVPVVETTTTEVVTTTTIAPTTTTTAPITTTTTAPEPSYIWDGEADFSWFGRPARLGVLRDEWQDPNIDGMTLRVAVLSGVFQGAYQKEITVAGDTVSAWFITMYMGEHPTTGRAMIVDFYIGGHPYVLSGRTDLSGDTLLMDPLGESNTRVYDGGPEEVSKSMNIGRQHLFMMIAGTKGFPDGLISVHKVEVFQSFLLKNEKVIDFLNGEREGPLPADVFGWTYTVYFPNAF